jgi:hypothetical protein
MKPGDEVTVHKLKWPDRFIDAGTEVFLGEDEHGRWHAMPAGRAITDTDGEAIWRVSVDAVALYPRAAWSIPNFTPPGSFRITRERDGTVEHEHTVSPREVYVHIAMPLERSGEIWRFIDLELDVIRRPGGLVEIIDEHDLVAAMAEHGLPDDVASAARAEAERVAVDLRARAEPFDTVGPSWLARAGG